MNKEAVLEGLLFVSGEDGISLENACSILEVDNSELMKLLKALEDEYSKENRGLRLDYLGKKIKLTTKKEHHDYYVKMAEGKSRPVTEFFDVEPNLSFQEFNNYINSLDEKKVR